MVAKDFSRLVHESTGWRPAYPLVIPIRVGDYFQLSKDGVPVGLGNARNWRGWADALVIDREEIGGSETYNAGCSRKAAATAGGGAAVPGGVGAAATFSLSFARSAGFVLAYDAATRARIRDVPPVQDAILASARAGWWQEDWILVIEVIEAASATLAVATEAGSELDLYAKASIPSGMGGVMIADPQLGWSASSWRGSGYSSICQGGTPLYHCLKLNKGMLGGWSGQLLEEAKRDELFTGDPFAGFDSG